MSNYNPTIGSWDLVYDLDLSRRIIPYVDIDCRDQTNTAYQLNSYALDFFKHGSEKLLIIENESSPGDTYGILLDFHLVLSSITTSIEVIVENDEKKKHHQIIKNSSCHYINQYQLLKTASHKKFYKQYRGRNRI